MHLEDRDAPALDRLPTELISDIFLLVVAFPSNGDPAYDPKNGLELRPSGEKSVLSFYARFVGDGDLLHFPLHFFGQEYGSSSRNHCRMGMSAICSGSGWIELELVRCH